MEETLGKRIALHRKRLGLTQDALAEKLGVTAQAVSKWENDLSCPDITLLPKLSQIFGITTDEMLGLKAEEIHIAEIVEKPEREREKEESEGLRMAKGDFEIHFDGGKRGSLFLALWLSLTAGLLLVSPSWRAVQASLWDVLWPSGLLVFGLLGLYPRFSVFRLGCGLFGGYCLLIRLYPFSPSQKVYLLPFFLLAIGLSLLIETLRKSTGQGSESRTGHHLNIKSENSFIQDDGTFSCSTSFNANRYPIDLPLLKGGSADLSFGELEIDLTSCEEIAEGCTIDLNASFGELTLIVPRKYRIIAETSTTCGTVTTKGSPAPETAGTILARCNASFAEICLRYV